MKSSYPATVFDKPQWPLKPDTQGPRMYANVSNRLTITLGKSKGYDVAVQVPTELFTFLLQGHKVAPGSHVQLFMDSDGTWTLFGAEIESEGRMELLDLWAYPGRNIPAWMLAPEFRL